MSLVTKGCSSEEVKLTASSSRSSSRGGMSTSGDTQEYEMADATTAKNNFVPKQRKLFCIVVVVLIRQRQVMKKKVKYQIIKQIF